MRLHLVIQRHGLPVTRILWTTTSSSSLDGPAHLYKTPATASAIASTRAPNALFANGGYTIAQLLEDVNEVVPLETEPNVFDENKSSGQWGLEDYVVEIAGSECLHFMEVEGLLRDDDVVVIRALQIADLKTRRLSGRHQISTDGRHLIDGIPFGRPYLKRSMSSRPAISIPPRKKRRTLGGRIGYEEEESQFPLVDYLGEKEISALRDAYQESVPENRGLEDDDDDEDYYEDFHEGQDEEEEDGDGTVIRHPIDHEDAQAYENEEDISDFDDRDLTEELQDLKEDMQISGVRADAPRRLSMKDTEQTLREDIEAKKSSSPVLRVTDGREHGARKSVRFSKGGELTSPVSQKTEESFASAKELVPPAVISSEESEDSSSSESESSDDTSDDGDDDSTSSSDDSTSDSESSSSSSALSQSEDEEARATKVNPPGYGSSRTKKSNQRMKMRRRLSKLKEFGVLPEQADFSALREWEETNGNWDASLEAKFVMDDKRQSKEQEQAEFEAKRQQLLRELEAGGVDIDAFVEGKHDPSTQDVEPEQEQPEEDITMVNVEAEPESAKKRSLDVASTRRMLFGSLGVKTPHSEEDKEATREKLAGKVNNFHSQRIVNQEDEFTEQVEDDMEENWQDKLNIRATECIFDDIELTAPPFPFQQRWDREAHKLIGERKGWSKKRKRKQRVQVYDEPEEEYLEEEYPEEEYWDGYENGYDDGNEQYENGELQLRYDDVEQPDVGIYDADQTAADMPQDTEDDLPSLPNDIGSIPDFVEEDLKKGSLIAFKQLDMSKDTNWQPRVSEYRVAEIHEVIEDGIINVRLAKRDRRQVKYRDDDEDEDEDEGPRRYTGFEMPGFDDDDEGEDDGFRELAFTELIEPRLLQSGPVDQTSNSQVVEEPVEGGHRQEAIAVVVPSVSVDSANAVNGTKGPGGSPAIKSPKFAGFRSPRADENELTPKSSEKEGNHEPTGTWSAPVGDSNNAPTLDSQDLQPLSTPESWVSFNDLHKKTLKGSNKDPDSAANSSSSAKNERGKKKKRKTTQSQTAALQDTFVPNPFYEIDKAHEERRRQESEKVPDNTIDALDEPSFAGFSSSPGPIPRKSRKSQRSSSQADHETTPVSSVPETQWQDGAIRDQGNASQMSGFVDLTQSSPGASPNGNGDESARSQPKSVPKSQRQTRLSSQIQTPQEVSGSPRTTTRKRRKT